jgi:hypothetical protein
LTDADDVRAQLDQLMGLIIDGKTQGVNGIYETKDAITGIRFSVNKIKDARGSAAQLMDILSALSDQLELILTGSLNADLISAIGDVQLARRHVQDFLDRTQNQINNLEKIAAIIDMQLLPSLEAPTKDILSKVNEGIGRWAQYL